MLKKIFLLSVIILTVSLINCAKDDETVVQPGVNHSPNSPSSPVPANDVTIPSGYVTLQWTCSDPDAGDSLKFSIYTGTSNPPKNLKDSNNVSMSYDLGLVSSGNQIYWQIVAKDNKGGKTTGPVWNFKTN